MLSTRPLLLGAIVFLVGESLPADQVTHVAGTGEVGSSGDGGPALAAAMHLPTGVAVAPDGTIYFADWGNRRIRRIRPDGIIETVAGDGTCGMSGDGGPAANASICEVISIALDAGRNVLYMADSTFDRIRRVDLVTGIIDMFVGLDGTPHPHFIDSVFYLAVDPAGNVYVTAPGRCSIAVIWAAGGSDRLAGTGECPQTLPEQNGDGGPATATPIMASTSLAVDAAGNLFFVDRLDIFPDGRSRIRRIDGATGIITTVAGGGSRSPAAGGPATEVDIGEPLAVATDDTPGGATRLYLSGGPAGTQILVVDLATGELSVFAGTGDPTVPTTPCHGPAASVVFGGNIWGMDLGPTGKLVLSDSLANRLCAIGPDGTVVNGDVSIIGTPRTTIDCPAGATSVTGNVIISGNTAATSIHCLELQSVGGDLAITQNDSATVIELGAAQSVGGGVTITENDSATVIELGAVQSVGGDLTITQNDSATVIEIGAVQSVGGDLTVSSNTSATSVGLGSLASVDGSLTIEGNTAATTIGLGSLGSVGGDLTVSGNTSATTVGLGSLGSVGGNLTVSGNTLATTVGLGSLARVDGSLTIEGNIAATTIGLGSLASVDGDVKIADNDSATTVDLSGLQTASGDVTVTGNDEATVLLGSLTEASGNVTVEGNTAAQTVDLSGLQTASGDVTVTGNGGATVLLGSLTEASGNVTVTDNSSAQTVDLKGLTTASGDVTVTGNGDATVLLGSLTEASGNINVESAGTGTFTPGSASAGGKTTLTTRGYDAVTGTTARGAMTVSNATGEAKMTVKLETGTFTEPVGFTLARLDPAALAPEQGRSSSGAMVRVEPVAAYQFTFAVPALNKPASLTFDIFLSGLDADTRTALLDALASGMATLATKGDAGGDTYRTFPLCAAGEMPAAGGCVVIQLLDSSGQPAAGLPAIARFSGMVGSFSTWAVVIEHIQIRFLRGNCNDDGSVDISDAICTLEWLFLGGEEPGCVAAMNANGDEAVDISDAVWLLGFLFLGESAPVAPHPDCGIGNLEADERLGCKTATKGCR